MPPASLPDRSTDRAQDSPAAWFVELLLAKDQGDFQQAAEAQRQLARLGWSVQYRKPRLTTHESRPAAPNREVGR
jgi:hypothetical protein